MLELEIVSLEGLVSEGHNYRRFKKLWDLKEVNKKLLALKKEGPHEGYGMDRLFLCLLVQYMENLSDRELEAYLRENVAGKWF